MEHNRYFVFWYSNILVFQSLRSLKKEDNSVRSWKEFLVLKKHKKLLVYKSCLSQNTQQSHNKRIATKLFEVCKALFVWEQHQNDDNKIKPD
jgi:hypothetical protein